MELTKMTNIEEDFGVKCKFKQRWPLVEGLFPRIVNSSGRGCPVFKFARIAKAPSDKQIEQAYKQTVNQLNARFKFTHTPTFAEIELLKRIKKLTKLKPYPSCWIGNRCVDIFLPQIKGRKGLDENRPVTLGLVIEVDGSVHDREFKQIKDHSKNELLASFGILVISIRNGEVRKKFIERAIHEITDCTRLDTRAKRRLWKRVHLATIVAHASNEDFARLFEMNKTLCHTPKSSSLCKAVVKSNEVYVE